MSATYNLSEWVWVPDENEVVLPALITQGFKGGSEGYVEVYLLKSNATKDAAPEFVTEKRTLSPKLTSNLERMDPNSQNSIENMVNLRSLSEASILHNLKLRFSENHIYTSVGAILVSVNPFRSLKLYTAETLEKYKELGHRNLPPHVYGIADMAYNALTGNYKDQSCIVSGESGAGKTEATKIFLQYIAEVSSQASNRLKENVVASTSSSEEEKISLQEQILQANPLMEAFGNAKTVRNDNSSRFGKWIEIQFNNKKGTIVGGKIVQYLLEKSRIVYQSELERNYHIFYNLCAGAAKDSAVRAKFEITEARDYAYLAKSADIMEVDSLNDSASFEDVLKSMQSLGISIDEQDSILMTIAGIMHLGNIEFQDKLGTHAEDSEVSNKNVLETAAKQLGVKSESLEMALTTQKINISREATTRHLKISDAKDTRDALAKTLYAAMFDWLIKRINTSFDLNEAHASGAKTKKDDLSIIGVLDIFGFEVFDFNSLEQLCINYCNEKLQFHFNNHIFKLEAALYESEGVDVSKIEFQDNVPTLELFEKKGTGIFSQMDEQMFLPHGTDKKFLDKLAKTQNGHPNFMKPGVKTNYERNSFSVIHYAGKVMYNVDKFLEKNSDKLSADLSDLVKASVAPFVSNLLPEVGAKQGGRVNKRTKGASLCTKFKDQLNVLMTTLNNTEPQFIRCIKPNQEKVGGVFTANLVLEQLRYAGLLEVCRIRKLGYPIRREFKQFMFRYGCLVDEDSSKPTDVKSLCKQLMAQKLLTENEFQIGKSKVFLRGGEVDVLEAQREVALKKQALIIQRVTRGWIERKKYRLYKDILKRLNQAMASRVVKDINQAIEDCGELPHGGRNRPELVEARKLLQKMEENDRMILLLKAAAESRDMDKIKSALSAAEQVEIVSNFKEAETKDMIGKCNGVIIELENEQKAKDELKEAMEKRSLELITNCLQKMNELGLQEAPEYAQGEVLRAKLEEAEKLLENIEKAIEANDLEVLKEALVAAEEIGGFDKDARYLKGKEVKAKLISELEEAERERVMAEEKKREEERQAKLEKERAAIKAEIEEAVKNKDFSKVYELKARAAENGLAGDDLDAILAEVKQIENINKQVSSLTAAMESLKTLMLNRNGLEAGDLQHISSVLDTVREAGLNEENSVLKEAVILERKGNAQIEIQAALQTALDEKNFLNLQTAIANADELSLNLDLLDTAREALKDEKLNKPPEFDAPTSQRFSLRKESDHVDEEEQEQAALRRRQQMIDEAKNPKYHFSRFYNIRSPSDYVRGMLFNKKKYIASQLHHQTYAIPKSILKVRRELNKPAIAIYKSVLGYCGEQAMQFPATLAQNILEKGLTTPGLVDEIYIQLCKHITDNKSPESLFRAWQLMCMAVGTFPPTNDFEFYLINFLVLHRDDGSLIGNYAQYSLRRLEGMLIRGASGFLPSLDEIIAYKNRPPVLSTIETVEGTPITEDFPVPPDLNVERVVEICNHFLELEDERKSHFGIFVQEEPESEGKGTFMPESGYSAMRREAANINGDIPPPPPLPDSDANPIPETPHPLRDSDFLGDVVVNTVRKKRKYTLVFKKKLFLPNDEEKSENFRYKRLMYLQAADEVIRGNVLVEKLDDFLLLTAIAIQNDLPEGQMLPVAEKQLLELNIMGYLPFNWASKKTEKQWARAILPKRGKVLGLVKKDEDGSLLGEEYVNIVRKMPLWGFNFFFVRENMNGNDIICGVRYEGLSFFTPGRKLMTSYPFMNIQRWGGSSSQFWCLVKENDQRESTKVSFYTKQAKDISNLILDYTKLRQLQSQQKRN